MRVTAWRIGRRGVGIARRRRRLPFAAAVRSVFAVPAMAVVAEEVQQRTGQKKQEGRHLQQMSTVLDDKPDDCCRQAEPEKPLVDAGPARPVPGES